jgi:chemotaxis protein MotB
MSAGRRKKHAAHEEEHENHERWLVSYADMMTLLMVLFIVLFAISQVDQRKFAALKTGLTAGFGATENLPVTGGTGINQTDGVVPAAFGLDVGLGIKQNTTTGEDSRAYQSNNGTGTASGTETSSSSDTANSNPQGTVVSTEASIKAAQQELQKFSEIENAIRKSLQGTGLQDKVRFRVTDRGLTVAIVADDVFFASASADLRPKGRTVLQSVGPVLAPLANDIAVEGNANNLAINSPVYPSNWELSAARASTVVRYLIATNGIVSHRLSATGLGSSRPLFPASDPRSVSYNRRVDLVVVSQQPAAVRALLPGLGRSLTDLGPG